jgi:hypothetical protein
MAKKRFESLNTAEQLSKAVEIVANMVPPENGKVATDELRRISGIAIDLLLGQSEEEFRSTVRLLKLPLKVNRDEVVPH